ncbi:SRPBCC family protein [Massilia sp. Mn16-1_5]|uniref:SRPBCC family protein n=1 Tax=Massilia sp. Mn16-1_5 TaxID=2079199 RepID=UPI00109EDECE|nr:SRPBCC family protein [Massilia sp. Mn16-1_5]THC44543.1 vanillate O-demethylase oxidoreductase VanB [Massilia sp. Mn16-1_5]
MNTQTDRIERSIDIRAPRMRVWRALADAREFGSWFGVNLQGQSFVAGERVRGHITHPGYEHLQFEARVERIEPERLLSFYWHPYAIDPAVDYAQEEPTLVCFTLEDGPNGGTRLTVVESGFDKVPAARRLEAFRMNSQGWDAQVGNIARHVGG